MKTKNTIAVVLLLLAVFVGPTHAQTWFFGDHGQFSFPGSVSQGLNAFDGREPSSVINDAAGNVVMYTDGVNLWNGSHILQNNGNPLRSDVSSTQGVLIVPSVCSATCSEYFIFTVDAVENDFDNGFFVTKATVTGTAPATTIVLTEPQQLATTPNQQIIKVSEKLCGAPDGTGGFWVYAHGVGVYSGATCVDAVSCQTEDAFFAVHVNNTTCTTADLATNLTVQNIGLAHRDANHPYPSGGYQFNGQGQMKLSPDGSKLAVTIPFLRTVQLFQVTNGVLSNPIALDPLVGAFSPSGPIVYGVEFSPNGNLLYVSSIYSSVESIFQFNISNWNAAIIAGTVTTLDQVIGGATYDYGQLQLGPDNRIYVSRPLTSFLDVIDQPNVPGVGANYMVNGQPLTGTVDLGLPNLIHGGTCESTTGLSQINSSLMLSVHPVPAKTELFVQWSKNESVDLLDLTNALGQKVVIYHPASNEHHTTLDVSQLAGGIYTLTVHSSLGLFTKKIVVE